MIVKRIAEPKWGPPIGRVLATLLAEGRQEALIQLLADRAFQWSLNAGEIIERVDRAGLADLVAALGGPPRRRPHPPRADGLHRQGAPQPRPRTAPVGHPVPVRVRRRPAARRRTMRVPRTSRTRSWPATRSPGPPRRRGPPPRRSSWSRSTTRHRRCAPASPTRSCISESRCATRPTCATRSTTGSFAPHKHLVSEYGVEITAIITETIERWDADEASRRIELHVGRDLQFIRINGTVVGALAGLGHLFDSPATLTRPALTSACKS